MKYQSFYIIKREHLQDIALLKVQAHLYFKQGETKLETLVAVVAILPSCIVQTVFADAAIVNLCFQYMVSINVHFLWKFCRRIVEDVENMATTVAIKMFVRTNATIIAHMVFVDGYHLRQILFGKHS